MKIDMKEIMEALIGGALAVAGIVVLKGFTFINDFMVKLPLLNFEFGGMPVVTYAVYAAVGLLVYKIVAKK